MEKADSTMRRKLTGRVVSDKMEKSVTVLVESRVKHPIYGKVMIRSRKYHAHADPVAAGVGDMVEIEECRPISKTKAWKVTRVIDASRAA
jgi:small subunit ribosomal protein S17